MNSKRSFINDNFRISQEQFDTGWTMPYAHYHNAYEIYILKTGSRVVNIDGEESQVNAHEVTLFNSNSMHKSRGDVPFSGICIHFSKWYLEFFFTETAINELMKCFSKQIVPLNDADFKTVCDIADNFSYEADFNYIRLALILDILNKSVENKNPPDTVQADKKAFAADNIIRYIDENYAYIKTIDELSQRFGVSDGYVHKIFRERFDTTPKHYINKLRIRHVCHCMQYTERPAKQLAAEAGFDCYAHFLRVFKAETGLTPKEYRARQ